MMGIIKFNVAYLDKLYAIFCVVCLLGGRGDNDGRNIDVYNRKMIRHSERKVGFRGPWNLPNPGHCLTFSEIISTES